MTIIQASATGRIYLSPPDVGKLEQELLADAIASNWVAPVGPHLDKFEREFCEVVGSRHAVALSSGTAALHLALQLVGVSAGDEVLVSTLTFAGSVNPITYLGARPVFIDSELASWNMDSALLAEALQSRAERGRLPRAVVVVHLYGQSADLDAIAHICDHYGVALVEDAAEALGALYKGRPPGTRGKAGIFSFNGNKIITTSGGGMLVSDDKALVEHATKLATQAREPAPHYEHTEIGYNYRLSNLLAAIGRGQLRTLEDRVERRRHNFAFYQAALSDVPGLTFMPEPSWSRHTRWLTCVTVDPDEFGADRDAVRIALASADIEARPLWKPMHCQPVFRGYETVGGAVAEGLFERGLCLPSGSNLSREDISRVVSVIQDVARSNASSDKRAHVG
jgi:dTDP-4-amino-4,6-dideoxygalactose transaminase